MGFGDGFPGVRGDERLKVLHFREFEPGQPDELQKRPPRRADVITSYSIHYTKLYESHQAHGLTAAQGLGPSEGRDQDRGGRGRNGSGGQHGAALQEVV